MAYPERLLSPDETVIKEFRPHWSRIIKELMLSLAVVVVLGLLATLADFENQGWVMLGIAVVWLILITRGVLTWWFTQHVITNERVIFRSGVFARRGKEIPLEVINDVAFDQSVWARMIRSGDLLIESAGEQGQSHYRDIPTPEDMQTVIYRVREDRMMELERGGEGSGTVSRAQQLEILARLHDQGKLSDQEYDSERKALGDPGA